MKFLRITKTKITVMFLLGVVFFARAAEKRGAHQVFQRWIDIQHVIPGIDIKDMKNILSENNIFDLKERYFLNLNYFKNLVNFFNLPYNDATKDVFFQTKIPSSEQLRKEFNNFYDLLSTDIAAFVDNLKSKKFEKSACNTEEEKIASFILLEKYKLLFLILFSQKDSFKFEKFYFALANNIFEFCFHPDTFTQFKELVLDKQYHPIVKLLQTAIWQFLVGWGWRNWYQDCLHQLKQRTDSGDELVYIAGGSDIYELIKQGIYNIRVIDPLLPSQVKYYSQGWDWLAVGDPSTNAQGKRDGGIGDEIDFVFDDKKVLMKRVEYKVVGRMFPMLSTGYMVELPESKTIWDVYAVENHVKLKAATKNKNKKKKKNKKQKMKRVGNVIIERRFTKQDDYVSKKGKVIVMSLTELISSIGTEDIKGWGIDPYKIDDNFQIFVKQLRFPLNGRILRNIRFACENHNNVGYIVWASDPT